MGDERSLELPALGRPMQLGMIYDCRDDKLIPGITLWDPDVLNNDRNVSTQQGTRFNIVASDSLNDKTKALNVEGSLKASLLGGLVEVRGSAEYIRDKQTSSRQSRLTLQYKTTVRFEQLTMKHLGGHNVKHPNVFEHGDGTHVVTGILYGAQAFFVFDRSLKEDESEQQVKGQVCAIIRKIPCVSIDGECDLKLSESEKYEANNLQCTFHGDFALPSNPVTFQEAVAIYTKLPSMLGKSGNNVVPLTVWLYPLSKLDNKAAKLVREISMNAIVQIQDIFEGLDKLMIKCDDQEKSTICSDFPKFKEKLDEFKKSVLEYKNALQRKIARALPKVRGGEAEEEILLDIISQSEQSPFNVRQMERWVQCREREMNFLGAYMKGFSSSRIVHSRRELDALLMKFSIEHTVMFSFCSLEIEDEYLRALSCHIRTKKAEPYSLKKEWFENSATSKNMRIKAKQFIEFSTANQELKKTTFGVMGFNDGEEATVDGGSIFLYENGVLVSKDFQPPGAPGEPEVFSKSYDSVCLKWAPPQVESSCFEGYLVRYREASSTQDHEYKIEDATTSATILNLRPNTTYQFSVAASCNVGVSQSSPVSKPVTTLPSSCPQDVRTCNVSSAGITVAWDKPSVIGDGIQVRRYKVKSMPVGGTNPDQMLINETEGDHCLCNIDDLQPGTSFTISVCASFVSVGDSAFSEGVEITIDQRSEKLKDLIKKCSVLQTGDSSNGKPSIYQLPLTEGQQKKRSHYQTYYFSKSPINKHFVVMLVGATGAGKSTLINGMINFIFDVDWSDDFRFKIIVDEGENIAGGQAQSQTQKITSYTINPNKWSHLDYSLTIIDTPGFGDTRGIGQDKAILDQIRYYFLDSTVHHVDHIDVIGFVAQASQARLTSSQRYVFDSVLSVFGKDIWQNICFLVTFADGQKPPVLDAIKAANVPCSKHLFKFNNSALFANTSGAGKSAVCGNTDANVVDTCERPSRSSKEKGQDDCFDKMLWKMGFQNMDNFFSTLSKIEPISLTLTQEVLKERQRLETAVSGLQLQIKMGCHKLDELQKEQRTLEQHKADIEANKDFNYQVDVQKSRKIQAPQGTYITNCSRCHFTCHASCAYGDDKEKIKCSAMRRDGTCSVCPGKCIWNVHFNQAYKFEYYSKKETRKYSVLAQRYNEATGKKLTGEQVVKTHQKEFVSVQKCVVQLITVSNKSLKRLQEIALRPNPLSTLDYVDILIDSEKSEARPGWRTRVKALKDVREEAEIMTKIKETDFNHLNQHAELYIGKGEKEIGAFESFIRSLSFEKL